MSADPVLAAAARDLVKLEDAARSLSGVRLAYLANMHAAAVEGVPMPRETLAACRREVGNVRAWLDAVEYG